MGIIHREIASKHIYIQEKSEKPGKTASKQVNAYNITKSNFIFS